MHIVHKLKVLSITISAALALFACTSIPPRTTPKEIFIKFTEPTKIQFQGKGAGAGMALMSSMGALGVALGVAIDVGIANEISDAAYKAGFDLNETVDRSLREATEGSYQAVFQTASKEAGLVIIKKYGFKIVPGPSDQTAAEIEMTLKIDGVEVDVHYPDDYMDREGFKLVSYPLEELKSDGVLVKELLNQAFSIIFEELESARELI